MDEKLIDESADRILRLFKEKEIDLPKKSIVADLTKLVDEKEDFCLPMNDAIRAVVGKYSRQHNIKIVFGGTNSGDVQSIADLVPNTWVNVEGEVVEVSKPNSKRIHQIAVITDGTGSIRVTVWNRKPDEPHVTDMSVGTWYKIANASVNVYNDVPAIGIQKNTIITKIDKKVKLEPTYSKISEIKPGIVNIRAKIVRLFDPKSDKVSQTGILGDETGTLKFVIWKSTNPKIELKEGKVYNSMFASCNKYKDMLSVSIVPETTVEIDMNIEVKSANITIFGNFVSIGEGSGIVKRCTVENCGRVLSRMNYCNLHEIQKDFKYDMRIKGVIDDGVIAHYVHVPLKLTEQLLGLTLEQAIKKSEHEPLGIESIYHELKDKIVGRYYYVEGNVINDRIIVSGIRLATINEAKQITGVDFKISPQSKLEDAS